jgi:hypothetical protein
MVSFVVINSVETCGYAIRKLSSKRDLRKIGCGDGR